MNEAVSLLRWNAAACFIIAMGTAFAFPTFAFGMYSESVGFLIASFIVKRSGNE